MYAPPVWATVVNPECKLLLLDYGFTVLGWRRIQLKTDIRNTRSIASLYMQGRQVDRAAIRTRLQAAR
mgnify:CR=1 FL=1